MFSTDVQYASQPKVHDTLAPNVLSMFRLSTLGPNGWHFTLDGFRALWMQA